MRSIKIDPNPACLVESMRDIGYSLGSALADLIDNSITARASSIHIFASPLGSDSQIGILDDGEGMREEVLLEAMRLGSSSPLANREPFDLGRFGLGLKTASFSQCRRLTVVSRVDHRTVSARWDLDHVGKTDKWEVQLLDDLSEVPWISNLGGQGTLVVWENLRSRSNNPEPNRKEIAEFNRQFDEALRHLELVFHRYLAGEPGNRKLRIAFNNRSLVPFDPFHSRHPATVVGPKEQIRVDGKTIRVQPFTLPHHSKVEPEEWEYYGGPGGYLRNQGFYLYRARRLIIHGTWFGLASQTELTKLARIRIDIPNSLDREWRIDIKKASAQLPPVVRQRLRRIIEPLGATSKRAYRSRGRKRLESDRIPIWHRIEKRDEVYYRINQEHPTITAFTTCLSERQSRDLEDLLEVVGATLPIEALLVDIGRDADGIINNSVSGESLDQLARATFEHLERSLGTREGALATMKVAEPFRANWEQISIDLMEPRFGDDCE